MEEIKNKIYTVTIGIPAFNEEANIFYLLDSLISQKEEGFVIEKILVVSDGSSDKTAEKVRVCKDLRIILINGEKREGKPARVNQIFSEAQSDIVVILDADIKLANNNVIWQLVEPLINGSGVMSVSGSAVPLAVQTAVQKIAMAGVDIWDGVKKSKYASPLYLSEGRIRAFAKKIYKEMKFPQASADEAFSFLYCAEKKYPFVVAEKALVYYNLPETFYDYIKQNKRFLKSKGIQESVYRKEFVDKYYTIGYEAKLIFLLKAMARNPFWTLLYLSTIPLARISFMIDKSDQEVIWEAITTSKTLAQKELRRKIIFSSYDSIGNPYYNGGGASAIHEVAKRLARKYDVIVVCGNYPSAKTHIIDGISYEYIGFSFLGPKLSQLIFQLSLPYHIIKNRFDVWVESFTPPFSVSFLPLFTAKPIIGLVHMLSSEDMHRKYKLPFYLIENAGLKRYSNIIVSTAESEKKIKKINPNTRIEIIPNGVGIDLAHSQSVKKHFLFIGRIEIDQKGLDLLLESYKLMVGKTNYSLVIAGSGIKNEEEKLIRMIKKMGISDKVKVAGRIDGLAKVKFFQETIAVIVPSRFETFSLTALEALAFGIPVVSFDIDGLKWLPENFSFKIKPFDVKALAKVMEDLSENKARQKINFEELKIFLKNYEWDSIVDKYDKYINEILDCKKDLECIDPVIAEIIDKKISCVFVSPHLDDAILSSGGLILSLASKTEVIIVTIFTEAALPSYTFSTKVNLKMCGGYKNAEDLFALRKAEDIAVCKAIGAKHIHLGFQDASFRKKKNKSLISRIISKYLPEAEHIYPIYRLNIISGKISREDSGIMAAIKKKILRVAESKGKCAVFCPLGIGNHVDHIIVREVCRKTFKNLIFWEDFPYNLNLKKDEEYKFFTRLGELADSDFKKRKIEIISLYKTQTGSMFPNGIMLLPERYYREKT